MKCHCGRCLADAGSRKCGAGGQDAGRGSSVPRHAIVHALAERRRAARPLLRRPGLVGQSAVKIRTYRPSLERRCICWRQRRQGRLPASRRRHGPGRQPERKTPGSSGGRMTPRRPCAWASCWLCAARTLRSRARSSTTPTRAGVEAARAINDAQIDAATPSTGRG